MNFIDAIKTAYDEACESESFRYIRRKTEMFDIRVRPYAHPETKRKIILEYSGGYMFELFEWGLMIGVQDIIADDWGVFNEELKK